MSTVTRVIPFSIVCEKLRSLCGITFSRTNLGLIDADTFITSSKNIANVLTRYFGRVSETSSYSLEFKRFKIAPKLAPFTIPDTDDPLNVLFTMNKLMHSVKNSKDTSPGPDSIRLCMIVHLPNHVLEYFC